MIKFEHIEVVGWEAAIRGMRNPKNSWDLSDSFECPDGACYMTDCPHYIPVDDRDDDYKFCDRTGDYIIGLNDEKLMTSLAKGGPVHAKYRRMIGVYMDITAPLFWWKEFDTYKVGTVRNSCSTMHKIHVKPISLDDFSLEGTIGLFDEDETFKNDIVRYFCQLECLRISFNYTQEKKYWRALIELLPSSYNMKATVLMNYEVLHNIYFSRHNHKQDEWAVDFIQMIESLPYSWIITTPEKKDQITGDDIKLLLDADKIEESVIEELMKKLQSAGYSIVIDQEIFSIQRG